MSLGRLQHVLKTKIYLLCFDFKQKLLKSNISLSFLTIFIKSLVLMSYIKVLVSVSNSLELLPYLFLM